MKEIGIEGVLELADWAKNSDEWLARKNRTNGFDGPDTFLAARHRQSYLDRARSWKPQGAATPPSRVNGVSPSAAWSHVLQVMRSSGWKVPAEPIHQNPDVDRAMREALDKIGGARAVGQSTEYSIAGIASQFQSEFARMYHV